MGTLVGTTRILMALPVALTYSEDVPTVLACADLPGFPWATFRMLLHRSKAEAGSACSHHSNASELAMLQSHRFLVEGEFYNAFTFLVTNFTEFHTMCENEGEQPSLQGQAPVVCIYGFISALACLVRAHLEAGARPIQMSTHQTSHREVASRYAENLARMFNRPDNLFYFLNSSGWPFDHLELMDLLELVSQGGAERPVPSVSDAIHASRHRAAVTRMALMSNLNVFPKTSKILDHRRVVRVMAFSMHATLLQEPISLWRLLAPPTSELPGLQVEVTKMFSKFYCHEPSHGSNGFRFGMSEDATCTKDARINELIAKHIEFKSESYFHHGLRFPAILDYSALKAAFQEAFNAEASTYDILMCGEPPAFCAFFPPGPAVIAFIGTPLGSYLRPSSFCQSPGERLCAQELFYSEFFTLANDPRNLIIATSMYLANQVYWNSGVSPRYLRPLGFYTGAHYSPSKTVHDGGLVLTSRQATQAWDSTCILNRFASLSHETASLRFIQMNELKDKSYRSWATHVACIYWPYDPQLLAFHELYGMGMPLFLPSRRLLPFYINAGYDTLRDFAYQRPGWTWPSDTPYYPWAKSDDLIAPTPYAALRYWSEFTDFIAGEGGLPGLVSFETVPELLHALVTVDLPTLSSSMHARTRQDLAVSLTFWQTALLSVTSSQRMTLNVTSDQSNVSDWPLRGSDAACWLEAQGVTQQSCCSTEHGPRGNPGCFDEMLTYERCCLATSEQSKATRYLDLVSLREKLHDCVARLCDGAPACNELHESEKCSSACGRVLPASSHDASFGRASIIGRASYCLASSPTVGNILSTLELFAESGGGATALLAAGVAARAASRADRTPLHRGQTSAHYQVPFLVTFEEQPSLAEAARRHVAGETFNASVTLHEVPQHFDPTSGLKWAAHIAKELAGNGASEPRGRISILRGRPYPALDEKSEFERVEQPNALRSICEALKQETGRGFDMVLLDTSLNSPLSWEWPVIEQACAPRWVVLHNVNLPNHAGWIKEHLLLDPRWAEVWGGTLEDMRGLSSSSQPFFWTFRFRRWSVLHRSG